MVVHTDHHRNEHDCVVEEVDLYARLRQQHLQETNRHWRAEPIVLCNSLPLQDRMLYVMPKLDDQSDCPPFKGGPGKAFPERPKTNQHHDGIPVMHDLGTNEPGKEQTKKTSGIGPGPAEHINLISLRQMLGPVGQHYEHEKIQCAFVPNAI